MNRKIPVSLTDINRKTRNRTVNYETVGYFDKNMKFVQTGVSQMNQAVGRMYVNFPSNNGKSYGMLWHTHPHNAGFWPSIEDLYHGGYFGTHPVNVLFTRYGAWIYKGFKSKPNNDQKYNIQLIWNKFHSFMLTVYVDTHLEGIKKQINKFLSSMKETGYHIEFVEHFNSSEYNNDEYTQKLHNKISKTLNNKNI